MNISNEEYKVIVHALELAIGQVSLKDGSKFRVVLDKLKGATE